MMTRFLGAGGAGLTCEEPDKILPIREEVMWISGQQPGCQGMEKGLGAWHIAKVEPRGLHCDFFLSRGRRRTLRRGYLGE